MIQRFPRHSIFQFCVLLITLFLTLQSPLVLAQEYWHGEYRELRYQPDGEDFVIKNGARRFNRALYGYHSDFRTEAGDLPLFSFYLPGMGGHFRFGIQQGEKSKWLSEATYIESRYRAGSMVYTIADPMLSGGKIEIVVMPLRDREGAVFKVMAKDEVGEVNLVWLYGGVTGKRFRRMGDLGADPPSVFDLKVENCIGNSIQVNEGNQIALFYGDEKSEEERAKMMGVFPEVASLKKVNPEAMDDINRLWSSQADEAAAIMGKMSLSSKQHYFAIYRPGFGEMVYTDLPIAFERANKERAALANRVMVNTPDPFINTIGGALGIAADAIYDAPAYVHGAVAWRMPLPGWRGAYVADWMGWHDRARSHFDGYLASQYLGPEGSRNDPDSAKHLARQLEKTGKSIFNKGYISRRPGEPSGPHHYDMNQVFFDQLIRHFDWTGDIQYLKEVWPAIQRHLAWEQRNFDPDDDGLYNAYASIWASDALQYNSGGVAHSSAYNYYAHKKAAELADILGEDGSRYQAEAQKILRAMNEELWLKDSGWYAEYKDFLGPKTLHPQAGVWSVYHTLDSEVPDAFQSFQMTRYVDTEIPHIPLVAAGLPEGEFQTISTTNWMPYTWSVNNVALAEALHTSLAYWQAGNATGAFKLWKSAILESMYLGGSPGNFQQLSFLDAMRSELYRDFADAVGMGARSLIEGLFGIQPDLMHDRLTIQPGFPDSWDYAKLKIPDLAVDFKREGKEDQYEVINRFGKGLELNLILDAPYESIQELKIDGQEASWKPLGEQVGSPKVSIKVQLEAKATISIVWKGAEIEAVSHEESLVPRDLIRLGSDKLEVLQVYDPENILTEAEVADKILTASIGNVLGHGTFFAKLKQGQMSWWEPIITEVKPVIELILAKEQDDSSLKFRVNHHAEQKQQLSIKVNGNIWKEQLDFKAKEQRDLTIDSHEFLKTGTNIIEVFAGEQLLSREKMVNWNLPIKARELEPIDISGAFNDKVTNIFRNEYISPRSPYPTLQIPIQGMGDWASYGAYMDIDDVGLRALAGDENKITLPQGIPFFSPGNPAEDNIVFTSIWDNYPDSAKVSLSGRASHAYLLMAGSTNHMQSRIENGKVIIHYKDGSATELSLRNPETWWPIEQDYYIDGFAFETGAPRPVRVHLKTGKISNQAHDDYTAIDHFTTYAIDGGAATVWDLPLDQSKELDYLEVKATTIEVLIGLMGLTLER